MGQRGQCLKKGVGKLFTQFLRLFSTAADEIRSSNDGGSSQNLILLSRGNAISGAPSISGKSQLPNPPINTGITRKKIIRNA